MVGLSSMSPEKLMGDYMRSASFSLTMGVFIGSALTTGVAAGVAAAWVANEKVLRRLKQNVFALLTSARDEVLETREGQALRQALNQALTPSASLTSIAEHAAQRRALTAPFPAETVRGDGG